MVSICSNKLLIILLILLIVVWLSKSKHRSGILINPVKMSTTYQVEEHN